MEESVLKRCSACSCDSQVSIYKSINASANPELKQAVKDGSIFMWRCPSCGGRNMIKFDTLYHDPSQRLMVWLCSDPSAPGKADALVGGASGLEDYTFRLVGSAGDLIEKVNIFDAGLDDIVVELTKYIAKLDIRDTGKGDSGADRIISADFKFLRLDGADDNSIVFAYPGDRKMEMVSVPFSMYENARGIVDRNPVFHEKATGFVRVDAGWLSDFIK